MSVFGRVRSVFHRPIKRPDGGTPQLTSTAIPAVSGALLEPTKAALALVPVAVARSSGAVPVSVSGNKLVVAMSRPDDGAALEELRFISGMDVEAVAAAPDDVAKAIERHYGVGGGALVKQQANDPLAGVDIDDLMEDFSDVVDLESPVDDKEIAEWDMEQVAALPPVVKLVNLILVDAIKKQASDILIEPYENQMRVRYRIDGVLHEVMKPPFKLRAAMTARLRQMARLDRKDAFHGTFRLRIGARREVFYRIAVLPTLHGEVCALRLIDPERAPISLEALGLEGPSLIAVRGALALKSGIVLVTSPEGGGRSTTLRVLARVLADSPADSVALVERAHEGVVPFVAQILVGNDEKIGIIGGAAAALSIASDVVVIDEIGSTDATALVRIARRGPLFVVGLAARDGAEAVATLLEGGAQAAALAECLTLVLSQELTGLACVACADGRADCAVCLGSRKRGRKASFSATVVDDVVRSIIAQGADRLTMRAALKSAATTSS